MINFNYAQGQSLTRVATPIDTNGDPSNPTNTIPAWTCPEPTIFISPAADGLSALITAGNKGGVFIVTVSAQSIPSGPIISSQFSITVPKGNPVGFLFS